MNNRVLRHQESFFKSKDDVDRFWLAIFEVLEQRDFQINNYVLQNRENNQELKEFKIARLCLGYFNVISLSQTENFIWIGQIPDLNVQGLAAWVLKKTKGDDSDNSNRFVLLESFLRFNFNRRSSNAMLNGLFLFFYRYRDNQHFKDSLINELDAAVTDNSILKCCLDFSLFMREKVLSVFLTPQDILQMIEDGCDEFPYVYSYSLQELTNSIGDIKIPNIITISSYASLPEEIAFLSAHREVCHIVRDHLGYDKKYAYADRLRKDEPVYECLDIRGDITYSAKLTPLPDADYNVTPCCFEKKAKLHVCYLFDGLDVLSSINVKVNAIPGTNGGLHIDLGLTPSYLYKNSKQVNAVIMGRVTPDGFISEKFRVEEPENNWVLYSAELEALISLFIEDLTDHNGVDMHNLFEKIYITEQNVILSRAEILNISN